MVLKNISPGFGVRASLMLFFSLQSLINILKQVLNDHVQGKKDWHLLLQPFTTVSSLPITDNAKILPQYYRGW